MRSRKMDITMWCWLSKHVLQVLLRPQHAALLDKTPMLCCFCYRMLLQSWAHLHLTL